MPSTFTEALLNTPIEKLELSLELKLICELYGFHTLAELLKKRTLELEKLNGFTKTLIYEYVYFLGRNNLEHYIDA